MPPAAQLASFGMTIDDVRPTSVELWEEHLPVLDLFHAMRTQWQTGMNGPTGLNYQALTVVMRVRNVARSKWAQMLEDIQVLEGAALKEMHQG